MRSILLLISDRTRFVILEELRMHHPSAITTSFLASRIGLRSSEVSRNLILLEKEGLVVRFPSGRNVLYLLNPDRIVELSNFLIENLT